MDFSSFFYALQESALAQWVNTYGATYPVVESLHVIAIALVFGTILIVDLRLLGLASTNRPFTRVAKDLLHLTWGRLRTCHRHRRAAVSAQRRQHLHQRQFPGEDGPARPRRHQHVHLRTSDCP